MPKKQTRNLELYPAFSAAYPARRLNLEGDPAALAPIPGVRIWPEADTSSPLQQMLGN